MFRHYQGKYPPLAAIPCNVDLSRLDTLFRGHVSEGRSLEYAVDYAEAMARFLGKELVEQEDVDAFYNLFSPYLNSFSRLQTRKSLVSSIMVSSGHIELLAEIGKYNEGVSKQQLSNSLMVSMRPIERNVSFLLRRGLVRQEQRIYHLSTNLEQFFNWYKDSFSL